MRQISALEVGYYRDGITQRIHDMPIGDAFKGPAFGEYEKNKALGMILGVVASVVTMGAALPMLAAAGLATQIAGGVMMAGGVMTGVGAITGNKKLMKIGGILSLAGGIGGWALNATGTAGSLGTGSEALSKFATSVGDTFGMEFAAGAGADAAATAGAPAADAGTLQLAEAGGELNSGGYLAPEMGAPSNSAGILTDAAGAQSGVVIEPAVAGTQQLAGAAPAGNGVPPPVNKGILDKGLEFIQKNGELAKIGGTMLTEFGKAGFAPDQEAMLAADARYKDAATAKLGAETLLLTQQTANRGAQVALISDNDPGKAAKIAAAKAAGYGVTIIPVVGRPQPVPGTTPTTNAQAITATNPAPVFSATVPTK